MDKDEKEARALCAYVNWVNDCSDCPHREWPSGKRYKKPRFEWRKCEEWRYYLPRFKIPFMHMLRNRIGALVEHAKAVCRGA